MPYDLSSLDSTVALLEGDGEITDAHAHVAAEALEALMTSSPEAFLEGVHRFAGGTLTSTYAARLVCLNNKMNTLPVFKRVMLARHEWMATKKR